MDINRFRQYSASQGVIEFAPVEDLSSLVDLLRKEVDQVFPFGPDKQADGKGFSFKSSNSRLILTNNRALLQIEYFGNFTQDYELCHQYVSGKLKAAFQGIKNAFQKPIHFLALITTSNTSFNGLTVKPLPYLLENLVRLPREREDSVADVAVRIGFKRDSKYYVNFDARYYESWSREAPIPAGARKITVRLHELQLGDTGIRLAVDVNTKLDAMKKAPDYEMPDLEALLELAKNAVTQEVPMFLQKEASL